uniref:Exocyst complex component 7 n=2 Tax=Panagrellus redivivus TaxID=6233 RepID=A0A7E4ZTG7_PANRE
MASATSSALDEMQRKLIREEEYLKDVKDSLAKSKELRTNISSILDNFQERIGRLNETITPLYQKTSVIQQKQQNVKKLLNIIDASIQFYGKTMELENTVRDGSPAQNLDEFLEKMESLKEAMAFFKSHRAYESQRENMKQTFESGCTCLESEFATLIKTETTPLDPMKIVDCLDDDYELLHFRLTGLKTLKNPEKLTKIARWMFKNASIATIRAKYAAVRSENINKTLKLIIEQQSVLTPTQSRVSKSALLKTALKKAAGRQSIQPGENLDASKDAPVNSALLLLASFLILTQQETDVSTIVFEDVSEVANVFRETIAKPLNNVLERCTVILEQYEGSFASVLTMARFALRNLNQLQSLAENVNESATYLAFNRTVFKKTSQMISDCIDKLSNDNGRFIPNDGNVHQVTAETINFLKMLAKNRPTVSQVLEVTITGGRSSAHFSKLFAQILAALGLNLKNKAASYQDEYLSALFMLNNLNYIHSCLQDEAIHLILAERHDQLSTFYRSEIKTYLSKYLECWSKVTAVFNLAEGVDERKAVRYCYSNFNREFDAVVDSQKNFCVADVQMAREIRRSVKDLVLRPYADFCSRHTNDSYSIDRQLKYDVESIEIIINRLFDASS